VLVNKHTQHPEHTLGFALLVLQVHLLFALEVEVLVVLHIGLEEAVGAAHCVT
jgi:hypothetical protein